MNWISNKMPPEHNSIFEKLYGSDKWNDIMFRKTSGQLLITIQHKGKRFVTTGATFDGYWKTDYIKIHPDAIVVAWMELPTPFIT